MAKRSFFEKMGLVERVDLEAPQYDGGYDPPENFETRVDVDTSDVSVEVGDEVQKYTDDFVLEAYGNKERNPSIWKVEEVSSKLPETLPTEAKRESVIGLLNSFDIQVSDLVNDGIDRMESLEDLKDEKLTIISDAITKAESDIEEAKKVIFENEELIKDAKQRALAIKTRVSVEKERITSLCEFIEPGSVKGGETT